MAKRAHSRKQQPSEQPMTALPDATVPARSSATGPVLRGLLGDIKSNPEDDHLRLILADWLEEQGDPRGEHIRLQCQLARMDEDDPDREAVAMRVWQVERPHRDGWLGPLHELGGACRFVRGLIHITCDADTFLGPTMAAAATSENFAWAEGLDLDLRPAPPATIAQALASPHLGRFSLLKLRTPSAGYDQSSVTRWSEGLTALVASPHLDSLRELNLAGVQLGADGLRLLLSAQHLGGVTSLDLSNNLLNTEGLTVLAESALFGRLAHLKLVGNRIERDGTAALARARRDTPLRSLDLSSGYFGDDSARVLAQSSLLDHCTRLQLGGSSLDRGGAKALFHSPHVARLVYLALGTHRYGAGLEEVASSPHLAALTSLRYRSGHSDTAVEHLARSDMLSRLERLDLSGNRIGVNGLEPLAAALPAATRLRFLNLHWVLLEAMGLQALAQGFEGSALVGMDLSQCRLEVYGAQVLSRLPLPPKLRWLNLGSNYINSRGVALLASSGALRGLSYLGLYRNPADLEGAKALAAANLEKLTSLSLLGASINAQAAKLLARAPWAAGLGSLDLSLNPLSNDGVQALAASPYLARLRCLELRRVRLASTGALALAKSPHLEGLEMLDLRDNRLSKKAVDALRQRFGSRVLL
jgi:uncharacterized protein (TIGR02996 family)